MHGLLFFFFKSKVIMMKQKDAIASINSILNELEMNEKLCKQYINVPFVVRLSEIVRYHSNALTEIAAIVRNYNDESQ